MQLDYKKKLLLIAGLVFFCTALVLRHYGAIPDFANGALTGTGIGFMLLALVFQKRRPE